ncbi:MAG: hypothetical protein ABIW85_08705 [Variovorax sp.]
MPSITAMPVQARTPLRQIALTVQELEPGEYYWVLLEAVDDVVQDTLPYQPMEAANEPFATYSNALVAGVAALRRMGLDGPRERVA